MKESDIEIRKSKALELLDKNDRDAAIDVLRIEESCSNADLAALLARAYYLRGDTKGDVYSSSFFARRAMELGDRSAEMHSIVAIGHFRKEEYGQAADVFSEFVEEGSGESLKQLYGLSLYYSGNEEEAGTWLREPPPPIEEIKTKPIQDKPTDLGGVHSKRPEVDSPYTHNALSKLSGTSDSPKDFHWLSKNIPCQEKCPASTDIPSYLTSIYEGKYEDAYKINLRDNVFPSVLGRVCARPCESECRHGWEGLGESVAICFSKRSSSDHKVECELVLLEKLFDESGKNVAVIGSGPAGLACARNLALLGHGVTVYEQYSRPGGMMVQGIPVFRLPREHVDREIAQIKALGVDIHCNTRIGDKLSLKQLLDDFDAVVLAAGTLEPNMLDLPGSDLKGIRHGLDYLLEANEKNDADTGKHVVVIGGGFTAMDCARTALRLGAKDTGEADWQALPLTKSTSKVSVIYRRSVEEMLVTPGELEELEHEGIGLETLASPVEYVDDGNGNVKAVRFIRNQLGTPDSGGRRRPIPVPGSEFDVPADLVLLATGQFPESGWIDDEMKADLVSDDGWLKSGADVKTAMDKIFVAGDFGTGARSLIDAIGHAKKTARAIDSYLMGNDRIQDVARIEDDDATGRIREMDAVDVQHMPCAAVEKRNLTEEVEKGYTEELAAEETQRCYRCHYKYEIDPDVCIFCDWCVKAKPRPKCIVKVSELDYDDKGEIIGFTEAKGSEDTNLIYINQEDCIRCNACVDACPVDAISVQKVTRTTMTCDGQCGKI